MALIPTYCFPIVFVYLYETFDENPYCFLLCLTVLMRITVVGGRCAVAAGQRPICVTEIWTFSLEGGAVLTAL